MGYKINEVTMEDEFKICPSCHNVFDIGYKAG